VIDGGVVDRRGRGVETAVIHAVEGVAITVRVGGVLPVIRS
jgi:hypothetical protein